MPRRERQKGLINNIIDAVTEQLDDLGVEIGDEIADGFDELRESFGFVYVSPELGDSVREMGEHPRDHTVMVRVDQATSDKLDAWVEIGAVRSRSEAAALFIREGLQLRAGELDELEEALRRVDEAKQNLRNKARSVFGGADEDEFGAS